MSWYLPFPTALASFLLSALALWLLSSCGEDPSFDLAAAKMPAGCVQANGELTAHLSWSWTAGALIDRADVLRATASGGPYQTLISLEPGSVAYVDTVPNPPGRKWRAYYYRVRTVAAQSNEVCKVFL